MNPPSSPRPPGADINDAISHIHSVADATPSRTSAGISQPDFGHGKRVTTGDDDGSILRASEGVSSPKKKRQARSTITSTITQSPMNLSESLLVSSGISTPSTSTPAARPPRVSLSPDDALADSMSNVAVSPPTNNEDTAADAAAAAAAAKKQTAKQKRRAAGAQKVKLGPDFFQYLRKDTFDSDRFKKGHDEVYSKSEMDKFDVDYNKQLGFDFCERRRTKNKAVNARASRSATEEQDLDSNVEAFGVNTTDRRQLSRYLLEDRQNGRGTGCMARDCQP